MMDIEPETPEILGNLAERFTASVEAAFGEKLPPECDFVDIAMSQEIKTINYMRLLKQAELTADHKLQMAEMWATIGGRMEGISDTLKTLLPNITEEEKAALAKLNNDFGNFADLFMD